jgi:Holliday junction resolvase
MPRESAVVARVRRLYAEAAQVGSHVMKTSGDGEPDLVGVIDGVSVVIECKQPGERPRALQYARIASVVARRVGRVVD